MDLPKFSKHFKKMKRAITIKIFSIFSGKPFPANFMHIAQTIMKRLFRIYAHVYHQHFQLIEELKAVAHLNTSVSA